VTATAPGDDDSTGHRLGSSALALADRPTPPPETAGRRFRTFDTLIDVPAFRWYLGSQTFNWSAMMMQMVVRGVLAYELTESFAALGAVELASSASRVVFALHGGVVADRSSRRVIIQLSQVFNAGLSVVMALLLFAGRLEFLHLVVGAMAQGVVNSFAMPARQAMIPEIVGNERLMNAVALNAFGMNVLRLVAPALAGGMIAAVGGGWVFAAMAVFYVLAMVTLFRIPKTDARTRAAAAAMANGHSGTNGLHAIEDDARPARRRGGMSEIKDALRYLRGQRVLMVLLILQMFISILSLPYQRLLPGFVSEVLADGDADRSAAMLGILLSVTAVGALAGSLLIASLPNRSRGKLLIASLAIFAVGMLAFAGAEVFWVSAAIVLVLGVGQAGRQSLVQILIQSNVSDEYRGRVSSIMLLEDGVESLGIFMIALVAEAVGPQLALAGVAIGLGALAAGLWSTRMIRELQ
jgi:MFS family permease